MQLLHKATKSAPADLSDDACARELLDTVPMGMRLIRRHMRRHRSGLTVPQFRTLCFLSTAPGSTLSAVADFVGLSLPAMSRLVDGLVEQRFMERRPCENDRRQVRLSITSSGERAVNEARQMAQAQLARAVASLGADQRKAIVEAMQVLRGIFTNELAEEESY